MSIRIALLADSYDFVRGTVGSNMAEMSKCLERFSDCTVRLFDNDIAGPAAGSQWFDEDGEHQAADGHVARSIQFPVLRDQRQSDELRYVWNLRCSNAFNPCEFDVVVHSGYPHVNWFVQKAAKRNPDLVSIFWDDGRLPSMRPQLGFFQCDGLANTLPTSEPLRQNRFPTELVPLGVDTDSFCPVGDGRPRVPNLEIPRDYSVVLMISNAENSAAVKKGIEALSQCEKTFLVVLVNQDRIDEELADCARQRLPDRHSFVDQANYQSLPSIYQSADLFLHLDESESFERAYLEAAASGLAIVSADTSVVRWIFGKDAFCVNSRNVEEVADGICQALDPSTFEILATRSRARILAEWTWQRQAEKMREFIYSLTTFQANSPSQESHETTLPATLSLANNGFADSASIES